MGRTVDARADTRPSQYLEFSAITIRKRSIALFLMRLPALIPWIFVFRGWVNLNAHDVLTNTEADVLGTGGVLCFYIAISITPLITLTGAQWIAPLRRWYGIWFAIIGISDATTAAITTDFAGGVFGRLAGHTFLLAGLLIITLAIPLLATANTPAQRKLGKYWKKLQRMTYVIWAFVVLHLLLLDGFTPFGAADGDGDPVFHQRFYQALAVSIPLIVLRLPPVRRWIVERRAEGRQWLVWLAVAPLAVFYITAMAFIVNEEFFTGLKVITMTHLFAN
jgi:DMSO/TMAO reductase YedYZ heme-binding membrane subunit